MAAGRAPGSCSGRRSPRAIFSRRRSTGEVTPTPVSEAARNVAEHASSVAKLELRLATVELKKKVASFGVGIGLGAAAAVLALFMLAFGLATIAAVLATFLAWWLALLIVTVALLLLSGLLGALALGAIKRGSPPIPEQAIQEAKLTSAALKS